MADKSGSLTWDVYVTELLPTASGDPPHGERQFLWQPTSAPLVSGRRDAILVDALLTVTQPGDLADWTAARNKNLTAAATTPLCVTTSDHAGPRPRRAATRSK